MTYKEFITRLFTIALLIIFLIGAWYLRSILMLGFLSVILAVALHIPARWLEKWRIPHPVASIISVASFAVLSVLVTIWIVPSMIIEMANLVALVPGAMRELANLYESYRSNMPSLQALLPPLVDEKLGQAQAVLGLKQNDLASFVVSVLDSALPVLSGLGNLLLSFLANLILVLFISVLLLVEPRRYMEIGLMLVPRPYHRQFEAIWNELEQVLRLWITAQSISVVITVALVWLILGGVLQMQNALIVALFAGVATFIPNVGAFLPLIPIVIFTLAKDPASLLVLAPVYLLIQLIESNILTPLLVKAELNIPTGGLLFFQIVAVALFGPIGLLLAAPLLAVIATLVREIYSYEVLGLYQASDGKENRTDEFQAEHSIQTYWRFV